MRSVDEPNVPVAKAPRLFDSACEQWAMTHWQTVLVSDDRTDEQCTWSGFCSPAGNAGNAAFLGLVGLSVGAILGNLDASAGGLGHGWNHIAQPLAGFILAMGVAFLAWASFRWWRTRKIVFMAGYPASTLHLGDVARVCERLRVGGVEAAGRACVATAYARGVVTELERHGITCLQWKGERLVDAVEPAAVPTVAA